MLGAPVVATAARRPVLIGLDAELGFKDSTSAEAIREGILLAADEVNRSGGVLGGRSIELLERSNNTIPARSIANIREFAAMPDLVAVFCGRFSPTVLESLPTVHELQVPLLDPWGAANGIVDNGYKPNFVFRLSMRDDWAVHRGLGELDARGFRKVGLMMLNTSWGRSTTKSAIEYVAKRSKRMTVLDAEWINWDDDVNSFGDKYQKLLRRGADCLFLTGNATEAALLTKALLQLPRKDRVPIVSHWGVAGGNLPGLAGPDFGELDFSVPLTFTLNGKLSPAQSRLVAAHNARFGSKSAQQIHSQVGVGHAFDLTHLLARSINAAAGTNRGLIRSAMENLGPYKGVVRDFVRPFTPDRHEALELKDVFMASYQGPEMILRRKAPARPGK